MWSTRLTFHVPPSSSTSSTGVWTGITFPQLRNSPKFVASTSYSCLIPRPHLPRGLQPHVQTLPRGGFWAWTITGFCSIFLYCVPYMEVNVCTAGLWLCNVTHLIMCLCRKHSHFSNFQRFALGCCKDSAKLCIILVSVADLGGGKGVQMHPPIGVFLCK